MTAKFCPQCEVEIIPNLEVCISCVQDALNDQEVFDALEEDALGLPFEEVY